MTPATAWDACDVHRSSTPVAYREYFPDSPPPTVTELRTIWAARLTDPTAVALVACHGGRPVGSARYTYERRGWVLQPGVEQQSYGVTEVRYRRDLR